jgi:leader peptidase (prepilin peptidase)/N-methyltransferase
VLVRLVDMNPLVTAALAGLLGLPAGSFANAVIHRTLGGPSVLRPAWRCPACGVPAAWRDNLPVAGWLLLYGRCRSCRAPIAGRHPLVEFAMGMLWFAVALRLTGEGLGWAVPAYLALVFICLVLAVVDATTRLLPNRITYPSFPLIAGLLLVASVALGDVGRLGRGMLAAVTVGAFFLLLALISPRGVGAGDCKFAPTIGLALGWLSWGAVAVAVVAAFVLSGLAGLAAMLLVRLPRKTLMPFGPWLAAGALLSIMAGGEVASWYGHAVLGG